MDGQKDKKMKNRWMAKNNNKIDGWLVGWIEKNI